MDKKKEESDSNESNTISNSMIEELDLLFGFASPEELKDSLMEVFLDYCQTIQDLPVNFKENTENFYFLFEFLRACEQERKKIKKQITV